MTVHRQPQSLRWQVQPEFAALLGDVLASEGETVKQTDLTRVSRHRMGDRIFYIKRHRYETRAMSPTVHAVRSPKSRREWRYAAQLKQRGVAVVPHLAHGERWGWRGLLESVLVTEAPTGYQPLTTVAQPTTPDLQIALGRFLRQMHDVGVVYLDLAPQNVLCAPSENAFCLLDLDKVSIRRTQPGRARIENLVLLGCRWPLTPELYEGYGSEYLRYADEIAARAQAERDSVFRRLSGRWHKHTHDLVNLRVGELDWRVRRAFDTGPLAEVFADPERFPGSTGGRFIVQRFDFAGARRVTGKPIVWSCLARLRPPRRRRRETGVGNLSAQLFRADGRLSRDDAIRTRWLLTLTLCRKRQRRLADSAPPQAERGENLPHENVHQTVRRPKHLQRDPFSPSGGEKVRMRGPGDCIVPTKSEAVSLSSARKSRRAACGAGATGRNLSQVETRTPRSSPPLPSAGSRGDVTRGR